jgi:hypothetical protein
MYFKNDIDGRNILEWWRQRCKEWCYSRFEDGKFGDQKYLDNWLSRFKNVHIPTHIGCGVAPWNIQQYNIFVKNNVIIVSDKVTGIEQPLIFFHLHAIKKYKISNKTHWQLGWYFINGDAIELIYKPYILGLIDIERKFDNEYRMPSYKISRMRYKISFLIYFLKNIIKSLFFTKQYAQYKSHHCEYITQ